MKVSHFSYLQIKFTSYGSRELSLPVVTRNCYRSRQLASPNSLYPSLSPSLPPSPRSSFRPSLPPSLPLSLPPSLSHPPSVPPTLPPSLLPPDSAVFGATLEVAVQRSTIATDQLELPTVFRQCIDFLEEHGKPCLCSTPQLVYIICPQSETSLLFIHVTN